MARVAGRTLTLHVAVTLPATAVSGRLVVDVGPYRRTWILHSRRTTHLQLTLLGGGRTGLRPGAASAVSMMVQIDSARVRAHVIDRLQLPLMLAADGQLQALTTSGVIAELGPLPPPALLAELTR